MIRYYEGAGNGFRFNISKFSFSKLRLSVAELGNLYKEEDYGCNWPHPNGHIDYNDDSTGPADG